MYGSTYNGYIVSNKTLYNAVFYSAAHIYVTLNDINCSNTMNILQTVYTRIKLVFLVIK